MNRAPPSSSEWPSPPATPLSSTSSNETTLLASETSPNKSFDDDGNSPILSRRLNTHLHTAHVIDEGQNSSEYGQASPPLLEPDQADLPLLPTSNALPVDEEERPTGASLEQPHTSPAKPKPISWMALPRKDQLAILTLARLSEPLTQTSLQTYMFYQLRSFDPSAPDSKISYQAGLLQAAFTGAQFCTAVMWGRMADSDRMGRKKVILIGLLGTAIGAVGFGFSRTFATALCWRMLGGGKRDVDCCM